MSGEGPGPSGTCTEYNSGATTRQARCSWRPANSRLGEFQLESSVVTGALSGLYKFVILETRRLKLPSGQTFHGSRSRRS